MRRARGEGGTGGAEADSGAAVVAGAAGSALDGSAALNVDLKDPLATAAGRAGRRGRHGVRGIRAGVVALALGATGALVACGGGEALAVIGFLGSAGGDWRADDVGASGFQQRTDCGTGANNSCFINIQIAGTRDLFDDSFNVSFTGNLPGCPENTAGSGRVDGERLELPGCFSGRYLNLNEALSDDGLIHAYFDSEVPDLRTGVWTEIQHGDRVFNFSANAATLTTTAVPGCELGSPNQAATLTVVAADIDSGRLDTTLSLSVNGQTWTGAFVGVSGMRLSNGSETLELQRQNRSVNC